MRADLWFDPEGDFQDVTNYELLFAELLEKAQVLNAEVVAEIDCDNDGHEHGFTVNVRADGRSLKFTSENEPEEWADTEFVVNAANELGKAFGFSVTEIEKDDQCVLLRITR